MVILTYILNEKKLIDELLNTYTKPDDLSIMYLTTLLFKKFYGINDISEKIKEELVKFNIPGYQEYLFANKIYSICNDLSINEEKRKFKELDYIPIYKSDLENINTLPNDKMKKLMFTLIANARYMNSEGWINKKTSDSIREIFKQANISGGSEMRNAMLHELYKNGYISFARANMNQNIKITKFDHDDEIVYKITDFKYLGNQYIGTFKKGYMMCKNCGKIIRSTGNKKMYCKKCAEEIQFNQKKIWDKTMRNK